MKRRDALASTMGGLAASLVGFPRLAAAARGDVDGLDGYIGRVRADWKNVGVAVAVVRGTERLHVRGYGDRELGRSAPIGPDTLFEIGSTSKAFTCAALGALVDDGKIRWDDRIVDWVPGFQVQDPWLTRHITIRDAAAHRTGVPDNYYPYLAIKSKDDVVRHLRYLAPDAEFRDSFRYNNLMYAVLGKVIEAATGSTWDELVQRRVFDPSGMIRSGTSAYRYWDPRWVGPTFYGSAPGGKPGIADARDRDLAMPHGADESGVVRRMPWLSFDNAAPAGSVVSSASDMANWLIMHLNNGRFGGRQVLRADTVRELHSTQNLRGARTAFPLDNLTGALGWFRAEYHGHRHLAHGGGILGFPAYVAMLPEQKLGVAVLSNGPTAMGDDYKFHRSIAFWVFDRLLGSTPKDWSGEFRSQIETIARENERAAVALRQSRLANVAPSLPLERLAGRYEDRTVPSGPVQVVVEAGQLVVRFAGEGAFVGHLEHWQGDRFRLHSRVPGHDIVEFRFAEFAIGPAATVTAMTLSSAYFRLTLDRVDG